MQTIRSKIIRYKTNGICFEIIEAGIFILFKKQIKKRIDTAFKFMYNLYGTFLVIFEKITPHGNPKNLKNKIWRNVK